MFPIVQEAREDVYCHFFRDRPQIPALLVREQTAVTSVALGLAGAFTLDEYPQALIEHIEDGVRRFAQVLQIPRASRYRVVKDEIVFPILVSRRRFFGNGRFQMLHAAKGFFQS